MPDRRQFLGTLVATSAASLVAPSVVSASSSPLLDQAQQKWDLIWLETVKAKAHTQVFELGTLETGPVSPLHFAHFWLNAHNEVYAGSTDAKLGAVVGIAGNGFPINFKDSIWAKYPLGDQWKVIDPDAKASSKRNTFANPKETGLAANWTVQKLQSRGVIFWMCNNALQLVSGMMADATKQKPDAVYAEFKAGLLPGVKLVPSHTMMITACQEHGCTYQRV